MYEAVSYRGLNLIFGFLTLFFGYESFSISHVRCQSVRYFNVSRSSRASENENENHPPDRSQWDGASLTFDISIWGSAAADPSLECHQQGASVTIMSATRRTVARQSGYFWTNSYVTSWPMRCPGSVLVTVTTVLTSVEQVVPAPSVPNPTNR